MTRWLWSALAWISLALAIIGTLLPVMPTVPFILLSAFAAARGSDRLRGWLLSHPKFGEAILEWERGGIVRRRNKWIASVMMGCSSVGMFFTMPHWWYAATISAVMAATALWLWRRPEPRQQDDGAGPLRR